MNRACFTKEKNTRIHTKMGEIHELFVLALSLVWGGGQSPGRVSRGQRFMCYLQNPRNYQSFCLGTRPGRPVTGATGQSFMCQSFMRLSCSQNVQKWIQKSVKSAFRKVPEGKNAKGKSFRELCGRKMFTEDISEDFLRRSKISLLVDFRVCLDFFKIFAEDCFLLRSFRKFLPSWFLPLSRFQAV